MQVYGHIAENSSIYRTPQRQPTLRAAAQSVSIHVHLESDESLCDAADYLVFSANPLHANSVAPLIAVPLQLIRSRVIPRC